VASRSASPVRPLPLADAELVARLRAGDASALEALHATHHDALWRFAHAQVRSAQGAEDIVQDVFLSLWRTRAAWQITTSITGWLYGAVRQQVLRYQRREREVVRIAERAEARGLAVVGSTELAAIGTGARTPRASVEGREIDDGVAPSVDALPERRRIAMSLRWRHQLSPREIAMVLGTTPEAVRVLFTRARHDLVRVLATVPSGAA
jgi:RNA polymerase sigma-70 factor (ECF subfamily)